MPQLRASGGAIWLPSARHSSPRHAALPNAAMHSTCSTGARLPGCVASACERFTPML